MFKVVATLHKSCMLNALAYLEMGEEKAQALAKILYAMPIRFAMFDLLL